MKKLFITGSAFTILFLVATLTCVSQPSNKMSEKLQRPKLLVGIVVDQMRWDYLYRYFDRYQQDGFKRMLREGFTVENTYINYVPTVTGIGHASIFTGSVPAIHGIAGNNFIINSTGENAYCVSDSLVAAIGSNNPAGMMSPRNLLSTTLGDELKLATNFKSKVIGIALKDRASILPAGHAADAAYWFDEKAGKWISSTWYLKRLPPWVDTFNNQMLLEKLANKGWNTLYPVKSYNQSSQDNNLYEGKFKGTDAPVLPVNTKKLYKDYGSEILLSTPLGNTLTLEMAKAAIKNEEMGKDTVTDLLTVSLSSTDWIGHQFGPNSIEAEDTYLRLDKELAEFFKYLDLTVGEGQFSVFLTADHGGAHNVNFLKDNKINSGGWGMESALKGLNNHLQAEFGVDKLVLSLLYYQVHFNSTLIKNNKLDREQITKSAVTFLQGLEGVNFAVDMDNVSNASIPEPIRQRIINGYHKKRSGSIQIIVEPGWYYNHGKPLTGTDHSSWNPYDSHIPLLFMGWGINKGISHKVAYISDIASTVSALLKIQEPNGNIGKPITEVLTQ